MTYRDYKEMKTGNWCSVGMFGDNIYAFQHIGGSFNHSEYYKITKREFELFPDNQDKLVMFDFECCIKLCSDYVGDTEFDEIEILNQFAIENESNNMHQKPESY